MFPPAEGPRLFGLPPGVDAPRALADGLLARAGTAPDALMGATVILNTARMRRRVAEELAARGPRALPRLMLLEEVAAETPVPGLAPAVPRLRRRLELTQLVAGLIAAREADGDAPRRAHLYELADSLNALFEEMHGEGVGPDALEALDVGDQADHWSRALAFLRIAAPFFDEGAAPDVAGRLRVVAETLAARWEAAPPEGPVIVAGSTGSRGATAILMRAVARLPQGALVLPGFDFQMPEELWSALEEDGPVEDGVPLPAEDHPQYRFRALLRSLDARPGDVRPWTRPDPPDPRRGALISLAMRPAPVTDQWLSEGPGLGPLAPLAGRMTLLEAAGPREEAGAIALGLRDAAARGLRAALVTPDRVLARRVTALLGRWGVIPDDSAGVPLHLSAPGRLLREAARLPLDRIGIEPLIALLKHPLVHSGAGRLEHLRWVRALELQLRRHGPPYPRADDFARWAAERDEEGCGPWCAWLGGIVEALVPATLPLGGHVARHVDLAQRLAAGPGGEGAGELWEKAAGEAALRAMEDLAREAPHGGAMDERDYSGLLDAFLGRQEVRRSEVVDKRVRILGTQEARIGGVDLAILGGLNDAVWPGAPDPDPWLNRALRKRAGLPLPERRIGLVAHDFQQAANAPEVWLSRAVRDGEASTVPSRHLARLVQLLKGLPGTGGPDALAAMRGAGAAWLRRAEALDEPGAPVPPEPRPAPAPPVSARPSRWSPSSVRLLIRDPYAVYARQTLGLYPLHSLRPKPDGALRGILVHRALERLTAEPPRADHDAERARLLGVFAEVFEEGAPWPGERRGWLAQIEGIADWLVDRLAEARAEGAVVLREEEGVLDLGPVGTLRATADRIDRARGGGVIWDYKTGTLPSERAQKAFEPQLLIEAMMLEEGAWERLGPMRCLAARHMRVARDPKVADAPLQDMPPARVRGDLVALLQAYREPGRGFRAQAAPEKAADRGEYDHLARRGEWGLADPAPVAPVG
ncbi:double-strand break repair protein AddB [Hasllibacter halocynthiae]|uniref:Double-strand break repair protein AddB n=1 Tax=Hasllibacter halocynthiae TaxID=595589 RepID=A0A2T0X2P2_9RHOB|nr:double-strand break repair protein AddB [Hasllibacter halocynthiae]PRY93165.1 double-strand break repair protein AddB [Hasllibacter halocynthiae]